MAATEQLLRDAEVVISSFVTSGVIHCAWQSKQTLSQFEHIRDIVRNIQQNTQPLKRCQWVTFIDDDDVIHPTHTASYTAACELSPEADVMVYAACHAVRTTERDVGVCDFSDVDRLLQLPESGVVQSPNDKEREYWQHSVSFHVLESFLSTAPDALLQNLYCDQAFVSYIYASIPRKLEIRDVQWLYFYDFNDKKEHARHCGNPEDLRDKQNLTIQIMCVYGTLRCCGKVVRQTMVQSLTLSPPMYTPGIVLVQIDDILKITGLPPGRTKEIRLWFGKQCKAYMRRLR
jgi:hypothetical protein